MAKKHLKHTSEEAENVAVDHPSDYEEYVTENPAEAESLMKRATEQASQENPDVKFKDVKLFHNKEVHTFLKRISVFALLMLALSRPVFATRDLSGLDSTRDMADRQTDASLNEIFARTRTGIEIHPVNPVTAGASISLATGDYYYVTGDTTITSITAATSYVGRKVTLGRRTGTPNSVVIQDGNNLLLQRNTQLASGDTITLLCLDDGNWYQIATADN